MSKFRRLSDDTSSDIVEKAFLRPEASFEDANPYAKLIAGSANRRQAIAHMMRSDDVEDQLPVQKNWERIASNESYQQPSIQNVLGDRGNVTAADLSGTAIRRIGAGTDTEDSTRQLTALRNASVTFDQALQAMGGGGIGIGGTFYDPEVQAILTNEAHAKKAEMSNRKTQERKAQDRRAAWEKDKMEELGLNDRRAVVSTRANPILMTGADYTSDGQFGIPDHDAIISRERAMQDMAVNKAARLASIKRDKGITRASDQMERQRRAGQAARLTDIYNQEWLDLNEE